MTDLDKIAAKFPNASESFKKANPHLFGVRAIQTEITKPDQGCEGQDRKLEAGAQRLAFCVSLVVLSRRNMDAHDNLPFSCKPLVDAIAKSLGRDDAEIEWEYEQARTRGQQGVMVKIEATP